MKFYRIMNNGIRNGLLDIKNGRILPNNKFGKIHICRFEDLYDWAFHLSNSYGEPFHLNLSEDLVVAEIEVNGQFEVFKNAKDLSNSTSVIMTEKEISESFSLLDIRVRAEDIKSLTFFKLNSKEINDSFLIKTSNIDDMNWGFGENQFEDTFNLKKWWNSKVKISVNEAIDLISDIKSDIFPTISENVTIFDLCVGFKSRNNDYEYNMCSPSTDTCGGTNRLKSISEIAKSINKHCNFSERDLSGLKSHKIFNAVKHEKFGYIERLIMLYNTKTLWNNEEVETKEVLNLLYELYVELIGDDS